MTEHAEMQALKLFEQALEIPASERHSWVNRKCAGDPHLHSKVSQLLAGLTAANRAMPTGGAFLSVAADLTGTTIDHYRLERVLGVGGMGTVYLASRAQAGLNTLFALKMINQHLTDRASIERFSTEQRALAGLRHPFIASFIELGESEEHGPYYVMEYVEGVDVTTYCDQHQLAIAERIDLWLKICDAVQSSHGNLIVHRDIKPSNVLVTDATVPKLVDFGIAKFMDQSQGDYTEVQVALTRDYASPERILQGVTSTHEDQYALGVLLYELIAGVRPFNRSRASIAELAEKLPRLRSPRMLEQFDALTSEKRGVIVTSRHESLRKIRATLRSDLDDVLRKALHPDLEQRYPTIDAFAGDVSRYLSQTPVQAKSDNLAYRLRKLILRNKAAFAASVVSFVALAVALGVSVQQTSVATAQMQRTQAVSAFLSDIITAPSTRWTSNLRVGGAASMPEILNAAAEALTEDKDMSPEVRTELHLALGVALFAWDRDPEAVEQYRQARLIATQALPADHPLRAEARVRLAIGLDMTRGPESIIESPTHLREAMRWFDTYAPEDDIGRGTVYSELGYNSFLRGEHAEAINYYERAIALWLESGVDVEHPRIVLGYGLLGLTHVRLGQLAQAEANYQRAKDAYHRMTRLWAPEWEHAFYGLLEIQLLQGRLAEATASADDIMAAVESQQQSLNSGFKDLNQVAYVYTLAGELGKADEVLRLVEADPKRFGEQPQFRASTLLTRGVWLIGSGRHQEALTILQTVESQHLTSLAAYILHLSRAASHDKAGNIEAARTALRVAESSRPPNLSGDISLVP